LSRVLEDLDRRATAVAAGAPECGVDRREPGGIGDVDLRAAPDEIADDVAPAPECRTELKSAVLPAPRAPALADVVRALTSAPASISTSRARIDAASTSSVR
jgi:hypothetical protein